MARDFGKLTIDNSAFMHYDVVVVDRQCADFVFGSFVAPDTLLKNITSAVKRKTNCYIENRCHCVIQGKLDVEKERKAGSDFSHMTIKKQDIIEKADNNELYTFYVMYRNETEFEDVLYDKLYGNTAVPIIKEWMPFIIDSFRQQNLVRSLAVYHSYGDNAPFECAKVQLSRVGLLNIVQAGLRTQLISIAGNNTASETMNEVNGLDMYLNVFGDLLAEKIQQAFVPKFTPGQDEYTQYVNNYDDSCHYGGIEIYEAQKAVIQAAVNNMNKNKTTIVVGEMGVGSLLCA